MRLDGQRILRGASLTFIATFAILGISTLSSYGLTFDEGLGNVFFGQRYLYYFATFDDKYLRFYDTQLKIHERVPDFSLSPLHGAPHEFPPFADTLSAATMEIFAYRLQWLDPIDAFHLFTVLLCVVLLVAVHRFSCRHFGHLAAFLAVLILGTYPRFWADMHFNVKDISQTALFSLAIFAYCAWYERPSWPRATLVGFLFAASLATKANALFLPVVLAIGFWPWQASRRPWKPVIEHIRQRYSHYLAMGGTAILAYFLSWPYLYADPKRVVKYFDYILSQGGRQGTGEWNLDPTIQALVTMPEMAFFVLLPGIAVACGALAIGNQPRPQQPVGRLLIVWLLVPILRSSLPGTSNFDGIRHFEEFVPAACMLAACGGASLVSSVAAVSNLRIRWVAIGLVSLILANVALVYHRYHPFQHTYFNSFVGGLPGAHYTYGFPEATDYWASSYRQGMRWLNANAEGEAALYVPFGGWTVAITAPLWLDENITVVDDAYMSTADTEERSVYVMFVTRRSWYNRIARQCEEQLEPVHEILADGVPILQIYLLKRRIGPLPPDTVLAP